MTTTSEHSRRAADASARVREVFLSLAKLISARAIYSANNPALANFRRGFERTFRDFFETEKELQLRIEQYRVLWNGETVYENEDHGGSLAFILYKDGVGEVTFYASVTAGELDEFVDILKDEIHNPSPHSDIVTRLWNADFANISYRVLDEDPSGQLEGEHGAGVRAQVSVLEVDDQTRYRVAASDRTPPADNSDGGSIADHLLGVVRATRPNADEVEKERYVQEMLSTLFSTSGDEKRRYLEEYAESARGDRIATLVETAFDFMRDGKDPTAENALTLAERAVGFARAERNARTLSRSLEILRSEKGHATNMASREAAKRLEGELVDGEFLRSLAGDDETPTEDVLGVLHYLRAVGAGAIPAILEVLHAHNRSVVHREACDALLAVAGDRIDGIVDSLNIDQLHIARDVVYLLRALHRGDVPPVLRELVHYPDRQVREGALDLLAEASHEYAVTLMCVLLEDEDKHLRLRALSALQTAGATTAAEKILWLCFDEEAPKRDADEAKRLFEAAGALGGSEALDRVESVLGKRSWLRLGGAQAGKEQKLLAISLLGAAGGARARNMLRKLAADGSASVRRRAEEALKPGSQRRRGGEGS